MRLVLDTNVVASALLWGGPPRTLLEAASEGRAQLFTSVPLLAELTDILARPKFSSKIRASQLSVDQLIAHYAALGSVVHPVEIPRIVADPDDDVVIGTALAAMASLVVTGDLALLAVERYQDVRIARVAEALQTLAHSGGN